MEWYPRSPVDYRADTWQLSLAAHGAYNLLLDFYYQQERALPGDDEALASIIGKPVKEWMAVKDEIIPLFQEEDGLLHQKRVIEEIDKYYTGRRVNADRQKKWRDSKKPTRANKPKPTPLFDKTDLCPDEDTKNGRKLVEIEKQFEECWDVWPNKNRKKAAKDVFVKLLMADKVLFQHLFKSLNEMSQGIVANGKEQFCPNLITWLKEEEWTAGIPSWVGGAAPAYSDPFQIALAGWVRDGRKGPKPKREDY